MLGLASSLHIGDRQRFNCMALVAVVGVLLGLSLLASPSALATSGGCTNTADDWTNTAGGNYFTGTNWSKGAPPSSTEEGCINAAGTYTVTMDQPSGVSVGSLTVGGESGTQTLVVGSTCSFNAIFATTSGLTIGTNGAVAMTNGDGCKNSVTLEGPVTNGGTLTSEVGVGGGRTIAGSLTNTGTLAIDTPTNYNGASAVLTNKGALDVAEAGQLSVSNGGTVFNETGGSIVTLGGASVSLGSGTTFNEGAGTTGGTLPVIVDDGTLNYTGAGASTIALRGTSGTLSGISVSGQTTSLQSTCSENATIGAPSGFSNGGTLILTNGDGCKNNVALTVTGTLSNSGKLDSEVGVGGSRTIQGSWTNTGTIAINTNTTAGGTNAALTNEGALDLANETVLTVSGAGATFNNTSGGSIVASGSANLAMGSSTQFKQGAGTTSGTLPVIVDNGTLDYTGNGASTIALRGSSGAALEGSSSSGQTTTVQSTCSENAVVTAASGFSNGGTMLLTNGDSCKNNDTLVIGSGQTLANSGKIASEVDNGGSRTIEGNVTNKGTIAINQGTAFNEKGSVLLNEGAIDIAEGISLSVTGAGTTVTNGVGGSIVATGNGNVSMGSSTIFNEGTGTASGTLPVIVDDATLNYTGNGASTIAARGNTSLSGKVSAGQTLSIQSTCSENVTMTAAASFGNGGTITLTNGDNCKNNVTLVVDGTLTNSGKIGSEKGFGGSRTIEGNLTNTGTLAIKTTTAYNGTNTSLLNEGALNIAEAQELKVSGNSSVTNGTNGTITTGGGSVVFLSGGKFTEGAGTTVGAKPVVIDDGVLDYTGEGKSSLFLEGNSTLDGNLAAGQTLSIISTCGENATTTLGENVTNSGTIVLTNGDGCKNSSTIASSTFTLTNSGQLDSELGVGGSRAIQGNLTNTGTVAINTNTSDSTVGALIKNNGAIDIAETIVFSVSGGGTVTNGTGGQIVGNNSGSLTQTGGTFDEANGATGGNQPVVLDDLTLNYTEHGSGPIQVRGSSTMTGAVRSGQTLQIASTCGENARTTASSFINNGTIELKNGDGCKDSATLNMGGGTLTNHEKLVVVHNAGGGRTIEGNLVNESLLRLEPGVTLGVTGNFEQTALGRTKPLISSESEFGSMSVTGKATLGGTLVLRQIEPFKGSLGQKFTIVSAGSLTGAYASETEDQINSTGLYYEPTHSSTGMTLVVTQATQTPTPTSGLPGSTVTVSGTGYAPGDKISIRFTDRKGIQTFYPEPTVNSSGEFSAEITIPEGAATGEAQIHTTSTLTGVHINKAFTVT